MKQICARFEDSDYEFIEEQAQASKTTRPRVVKRLVENALSRQRSGVSEEPGQAELMDRIKMLEQQVQERDSEIGFLRGEYSKINDALAQRLLTETKPTDRGFWARAGSAIRDAFSKKAKKDT